MSFQIDVSRGRKKKPDLKRVASFEEIIENFFPLFTPDSPDCDRAIPLAPAGDDVVVRDRRWRQFRPLQEEKLRQDDRQEEEWRGRREPWRQRGARYGCRDRRRRRHRHRTSRPTRAPGGIHQGGPQQFALVPRNLDEEGAALAKRGQP